MIDMTDDELRKEVRRILRGVGRDIREVGAMASASPIIPLDAVNKLKEFRKQIKRVSIKKATGRTLRNYYRDIRYIRNLKTSTPEGAIEASYLWTPVAERLKAYSKKERDSFWDVWGKIYSLNHLMENFKYEIFGDISETVFGEQGDDIAITIEEIYSKTKVALTQMYGHEPTEQQITDAFISQLQELFGKHF